MLRRTHRRMFVAVVEESFLARADRNSQQVEAA